jgi:hypothetical protein
MRADAFKDEGVAFDSEVEAPPPLTLACQMSRASSYFCGVKTRMVQVARQVAELLQKAALDV